MYKRIVFVILALTLTSSILTPQSTTSTDSVNRENALIKNKFSPSKSEATSTNETKPYGGTLRMSITYYAPYSLNPLLDFGLSYPTLCPTYSSLLRYNENGSLVPDLARDFEVSADGLDVFFNFYKNITWHDGYPFNSSDVKFTYETIINETDVLADFKELTTHINSIVIMNATSIKFHLSEKFSPFISYAASIPIIPMHIYSNPNYTLSTNPANENPVGTGPFRFYDWNPGKNLTLQANQGYFRGRPYLDSLHYRWDIPIVDLGTSLENNEIDMVVAQLEPEDMERLKQVTGITTLASYRLGFCWLGMNLANPILANLTVRQAIAHSINKTQLVKVSMLGYAWEASSPIPPSMGYWHNKNVTTYYYDPSIAEELLDQCGYYRQADGWRFNLSIKEWEGVLESPSAMNSSYRIRDYLKEIGINVTLELLPWGEFKNAWDSGDFEILGHLCWGFFLNRDPDVLSDLFHSEATRNTWNYNNTRVDELVEQAQQTYNNSLRKELYDEAQDVIATELPNLFLLHTQWRTALNNDFHGILSTPYMLPCSSLVLEKVWYEPTLSGEGNCPYWICYMHEGKRTGYHPWYGELTQIPNSTYSGKDSDPQVVKLRSPKGVYYLDVICKDNGTHKYEVEIVNIALNYKHIQIVKGTLIGRSIVDRIRRYVITIFPDGTMTVNELRIGSRPRNIYPLPY